MIDAYNLISTQLPKTITVDGKEYPLLVSTARAIDVLSVLEDKKLSQADRYRYMIKRLAIIPEDEATEKADKIVPELLKYLAGAPTPEYEKTNLPTSNEPVIYWDLDSPAIVASFRQAYGISLTELQNLHWWEFYVLLLAIPSNTRLGQLFATRVEVIDPKLKGEERRQKEELKKGAKPKDKRTLAEKEQDAQKQLASIL